MTEEKEIEVDWSDMEYEDEKTIITQQNLDAYLFKNLFSEYPEYVNLRMENKKLIGDLKINYKDKHLLMRRTKTIQKGNYGEIYEYSSEGEDPIKYAVKFSINPGDLERKAINALREREIKLFQENEERSDSCLVPGKIVISDNFNISIMPLMDGDLVDFYDNSTDADFDFKIRKNIFENVRAQLQCILNLNHSNGNPRSERDINIEFAYMDLKPDNVLYKLNKDGTYTFLLGDIGSIIPFTDSKGDKFFTTNTPCSTKICEEKQKVYIKDFNIISCMRYIFGIFCFKLLYPNIDTSKFISLRRKINFSEAMVKYLGKSYDNLLYDETPDIRTGMY
jgi:hypothetical protein